VELETSDEVGRFKRLTPITLSDVSNLTDLDFIKGRTIKTTRALGHLDWFFQSVTSVTSVTASMDFVRMDVLNLPVPIHPTN
jgi:hypothetical protein